MMGTSMINVALASVPVTLKPNWRRGTGILSDDGPRMTSAREIGGDFDRDSWDRRWLQALREGAHAIAQRPANAYLLAEVADLLPGRTLDAGSGHGAETLWLASRGWRVAAVDFSTTALEHARSRAENLGDPTSGLPTLAAGQVQVSVETALAALEPDRWQVVVVEDRPRAVAGSGVDAVVHARRRA
jgi:SAM-dependent methyltransferase